METKLLQIVLPCCKTIFTKVYNRILLRDTPKEIWIWDSQNKHEFESHFLVCPRLPQNDADPISTPPPNTV